jgi:hypothetical protein
MSIPFKTAPRFALLTALLLAFLCNPAARGEDTAGTASASTAANAGAAAGDGTPVGVVPVPGKLAVADVKACVARAFAGRKYQIVKDGDGIMAGHYKRGAAFLTLTVRYNEKEAALFAVGQWSPPGYHAVILPVRWIDAYKKDLATLLGRKAGEK